MHESSCDFCDDSSQHAHLHVIPRFDDELLADQGGPIAYALSGTADAGYGVSVVCV
jgi:diadenosine tetraphosphate (Ap4A) HIT family hydrolase